MVRLIRKRSVLSAVCMGLAWFGTGCGNTSVNEAESTGASGTAAAAEVKNAPPPPKSVKDYYERTQGANASAATKATPTTKGGP